ncbi:uncharacterized protein LOC129922821 isoform X1 [Biomphalaria glabrata]|uniref:Uncharacterized protein LOC129922821 isoform X1 n=1 Tax=Biomphalaria glabrata TaxID=6526 RepID=A0A9W2YUE8_BIOGL|nr:uncharacterized protein LOC129922821 isoform X1 [Biomphalaria glabrata]XP_055866346.1 uncharacterized protein LOC129922821 isoform X1 [Biomphalaria glabrata]
MSCKRKTPFDRKVCKIFKPEKNCTFISFAKELIDQTVFPYYPPDLADFISLGDENQDTDSHHFTNDQSKVQSDDVEDPLIDDHKTQESEGGKADLHKYLVGCEKNPDPHHFTNDQSKVQSDEVKGQLIGDHEFQKSEGGEADLHKHRRDCKKNPGHSQFIPVDTFALKDLPDDLQDDDLYELIKVTADLTVQINVRKISPHRPEHWPKTSQPYPYFKMSEKKNNLYTGSGRVWIINKYQDGDVHFGRTGYPKCWCRKCEKSNSSSKVWWEFGVNTATHVVFDNIEAEYTTLRLFYDRDGSPEVIVDKLCVTDTIIEDDRCELRCVTCDDNLGNKLMKTCIDFEKINMKVYHKYSYSRSKKKLTFIVSHPHGCSKQISVGQWKDKIEVDINKSQFTYTTCTCPGSSGAHVYCLGYNWTFTNLIHTGCFLKSGLNCSGVSHVY